MNPRFAVVETHLTRAEARWKWLRFVLHSSILGLCLCVLVLALSAAILKGWVSSLALATTLFALLAVFGFIAWMVVIVSVAAGTCERSWLAAAIEKVEPRFLDRLNTLLFLERRSARPTDLVFARRIARQAQGVVAERVPPKAFSSAPTLSVLLGFLIAALATGLVIYSHSPWQHLLAARKIRAAAEAAAEKPLDLSLPTNNVEQSLAWGEVRITEPGADLKVTKVDVVPLQIEAAANQMLGAVNWFSTVNGRQEATHDLPPPSEPRYAIYQPILYLDELGLADWDVLTYYARATTDTTNAYASEVYFLEVRPFREDILKMPGGEKGNAYQTLNEISSLISRQQQVIRQTHQHVQRPPEPEQVRVQDRKKLADAEDDLGDSTRHLYAKMAADMENKPIGEALDNLAKAEGSLDSASQSLNENVMPTAQDRERDGLFELVAARKMFQKAVSDNPDAFEPPKPDGEETSPVVDSAKKLSQMAEFRDEARAARQFLQKTLEQQKALEQEVRGAARRDFPRLGEQEKQLQQSLADFQAQHPQSLKNSQPAHQAMQRAANSLGEKSLEASADTQSATRELAKLNSAAQRESAAQQLADAYKLKEMLDRQARTFDQSSRDDSKISDDELQSTAGAARETLNQLKRSAEQEPTRDAFGQPLRDALSGQNKVDLDASLMRLQQPQSAAERREQSGQARDALAGVSKAFEASQPKSLRLAQKGDSLKTPEQDRLSRGLAELDSLLKQMEKNGKVSPGEQAKQGQQALDDLQSGLAQMAVDNEANQQALLSLQQLLREPNPADLETLKKLMQQLQHFSVETSAQQAKHDDKPEVSNIDPTRLPPVYRGRIQKYFEKLSER